MQIQMLNQFEHLQLFRDKLFKGQFQELFASSMAQSLKLDQFLLFEIVQDWVQVPSLVLCASTGVFPSEIMIPVNNMLLDDIDESCGAWFIPDLIDPPSKMIDLSRYVSRLGGRSMLVNQVELNGDVRGFLVGYSEELRNFCINDLQFFSLLTFSMNLLVENSQLRMDGCFRESESQSFEMISLALVENKNLDKTLTLIANKTVQLLQAHDVLVLLLEEGGEWFRVQGRIGESVTHLAHRRLTVRNSLNGRVITTGQPLISQDAQIDPRADQKRAIGLNARSVIIAPLLIREQVIGTMAVHYHDDSYFREQDVIALCSFANQASVAIDNSRLLKALLKSQKDIEEKAKTLQRLLKETINIQENERRRIAADIHDGVVSQIIGALYELEAWNQLTPSECINDRLQLLKQLLNQAIENTRTSIYNLWPATLDHMGLLPSLQELFKHQEKLTNLRHRIQVFGEPYRLTSAIQIAVYRIVQETINNVFQHSSADKIDMQICFSERKVSFRVSDDGQGFNVQEILQSRHADNFGLIGMRERAQSIGGDLYIESEPGKGCRITIDIPIADALSEGLPRNDPNTGTDSR